MIELIDILRCPTTGSGLRLADQALLDRLNQGIAQGQVYDQLGRQLTLRLDGALVNSDSTLGYGIYDRIPSLVADESIPLRQLADEEDPHE